MKKILRKTLSMLLAVSALCILFAFQASALTISCPVCHGTNLRYDSLGNVEKGVNNVYHHEVYCYDCECAVFEENCEGCVVDPATHDCTKPWICFCGNPGDGDCNDEHRWAPYMYNPTQHHLICSEDGCDGEIIEDHTWDYSVPGWRVCTACGYYEHY